LNEARWLYAPTGRKGIAQGKAKRRPGIRYVIIFVSPERAANRCQAPGVAPGRMLANRELKSVPGTRCDARPDASKQGAPIGARHPVTGCPNRCQAPGETPGRMLANRAPAANRCKAPGEEPGRMLANRVPNRCEPKSVPGTR
jgi:hypothetical protein